MEKKSNRTSEVLLKIANKKYAKGEVSYQQILEIMGDQAFGMIILFFALPSALPFSTIPGVSVIFSIPIILFSLQIILGKKKLWLPNFLGKRRLQHATLAKFIYTAEPYLVKIEKFLKPRWSFMSSRFMQIFNGLFIFCLALLLTLPIPFSNFILAFLLIIFSLGLIEKDGIFISIGYLASIIYVSFMYLIILAAIKLIFN